MLLPRRTPLRAFLLIAVVAIATLFATGALRSGGTTAELQPSGLGSVGSVNATTAKPSKAKAKPLNRRQVARADRVARRAERRQARRLASPAARRQRLKSRTKFRNLTADQAIAAVKAEQPALVERETSLKPHLRKGERIIRWASRTAAVVEQKTAKGTKLAIAESTGAPMAVKAASGKGYEPIDLSLVDATKDAWKPKRGRQPLAIPRASGGDVLLGNDLAIKPARRDVPGSLLTNSSKVLYPGTDRDTDVMVEPHAAGAEISWVLRSPDAPSSLPLDIAGQGGDAARFEMAPDGGANIIRDGNTVGRVGAPYAWDAQGQTVDASLKLIDGRLEVSAHAEWSAPDGRRHALVRQEGRILK
ncbi:MAG: hypothetical protein J7513_16690, partial [Solirubrobacteraceae bacterium]|nr:hypothetical protein [Solirubrobacteraceae bacterium]